MPDKEKRNPWQLYSSCPGWEAASDELDAALNDAIRAAHLARADGKTRSEAEKLINDAVMPVMKKHREFGAMDSDGFHYLEAKIERAFA